MSKQRKRFWMVIFVIFNIAIVAYTAITEFGGKSKSEIILQFGKNGALYILGALGCLAVVLAAETAKYAYMMRITGEKVSWRAAFETAALGKYYDCITPSGAGGQPFQIYWLHKYGYSSGPASAMPIIGFLTMQAGFIILAFLTFLTWRSMELEAIRVTAYIGLAFYTFVPALIVGFSIFPKAMQRIISGVIHLLARIHLIKDEPGTLADVLGKLEDFHKSLACISGRKHFLGILLFLSLIYQVALCSIPYFVLMALGGDMSYPFLLATTFYIYAAVTIVPTPGNSGVSEGVFYLVFSSLGSDGVFWAMIIWRLLCYYSFIVIGGLVYGFHTLQKKMHKERR